MLYNNIHFIYIYIYIYIYMYENHSINYRKIYINAK